MHGVKNNIKYILHCTHPSAILVHIHSVYVVAVCPWPRNQWEDNCSHRNYSTALVSGCRSVMIIRAEHDINSYVEGKNSAQIAHVIFVWCPHDSLTSIDRVFSVWNFVQRPMRIRERIDDQFTWILGSTDTFPRRQRQARTNHRLWFCLHEYLNCKTRLVAFYLGVIKKFGKVVYNTLMFPDYLRCKLDWVIKILEFKKEKIQKEHVENVPKNWRQLISITLHATIDTSNMQGMLQYLHCKQFQFVNTTYLLLDQIQLIITIGTPWMKNTRPVKYYVIVGNGCIHCCCNPCWQEDGLHNFLA